MKVVLTGAAGFIGTFALRELCALTDIEIVALSRRPPETHMPGVRWRAVDLQDADAIRAMMREERPSHLLHLAWTAEPGAFWTSPDNLNWVAASMTLQTAFADAGGHRIVAAGTCAEYGWEQDSLLSETSTPLEPATLYGLAKRNTGQLMLAGAKAGGCEAAWGRVFWLYGPGEKAGRLASDVACALVEGRIAECSEGRQQRDFLHVADVAGAFVAALRSDYCGAFNIGSGEGTAVRDLVTALCSTAGNPKGAHLGARPDRPGDPPLLVADTSILRERIGFRPQIDLATGIADTWAWWRSR